ncbi:MAG: right-handed parallel beta-helix repeat-containing protein [Bacteroidota bacterium]
MKTCLLILFLTIQSTVLAQVTGRVLLAGTSGEDNSGIKVTFFPHSPTAQLDSAFTDKSGAYSINLKGGIYIILFSKAGYRDLLYANGEKITLQETQKLYELFLYQGSTQYLSGKVEGKWTSNVEYIVNGDLELEAGKELLIEPGTKLLFYGKHSFYVNGKLTAIGDKIRKITFCDISGDGSQPGDWGSIYFKGNGASGSVLSYCVLEGGGSHFSYAYSGSTIICSGSSPTIRNSEIRQTLGSAIYMRDSRSLIESNTISGFSVIGLWADWGDTSPTIRCNIITEGSYKGIKADSYGSPIISGNTINRIGFGGMGSVGIGVSNSCTPLITDNFISGCNMGIESESSTSLVPDPTIRNNTIYSNGTGILLRNTTSATITMNILTGNGTAVQSNSSPTPKNISYNLFWDNKSGNFSGIDIAGIGEIITKNSNGHDVDSYFNIMADPLFAESPDNLNRPMILPGSPVVDGGDPAFKDTDGTTKDVGATANSCEEIIASVQQHKVPLLSLLKTAVFNSSSNSILIQYELSSSDKDSKIEIYSVNGIQIESLFLNASRTTEILSAENLPAGIYLCVLYNAGTAHSVKFSVIR